MFILCSKRPPVLKDHIAQWSFNIGLLYIKALAKWPKYLRQCQIDFTLCKCWYFDSNFTDICSLGYTWQLCLCYGFRCQGIKKFSHLLLIYDQFYTTLKIYGRYDLYKRSNFSPVMFMIPRSQGKYKKTQINFWYLLKKMTCIHTFYTKIYITHKQDIHRN